MFYDTSNPLDKANFELRAKKLAESGKIIELKEKKPVRSNNQNRYLHLIIGYFACQYGCGMEEAKVRFYKLTCNPDIFWIPNPKREGEKMIRSSATLDTSEMTTSIERFRNWSSIESGIYLPSPDEERMLELAEMEIERNKNFV